MAVRLLIALGSTVRGTLYEAVLGRMPVRHLTLRRRAYLKSATLSTELG